MRNKQTKIVATISSDNADYALLQKLYESGMNVVRLNTAHQGPEEMIKTIRNARKISDEIAILIDTKGPEVRISEVKIPIDLKKGQKIKIRDDNFKEFTTGDIIRVSYGNFAKEVPLGRIVLIDDGSIGLKVIKRSSHELLCQVQNDGKLRSRKSVNVPHVHLDLPSLTKRDIDNIHFAIKQDIEFIAHSFVRNKEDVLAIKKILDKHNSKIKIISKIENKEGVDNIHEILEHSYGIMVARGDLGVELPGEEVPLIQKKLIKICLEKAKPVITATQMLESMITNPRPTRAEMSDVANAILDGTDAIMLSGETAYGKYPVEAVQVMSRIAKHTESQKHPFLERGITMKHSTVLHFLAREAVYASLLLPIKSIIVHSVRGESARLVSSYRGSSRIFATCSDKTLMRQLALSYGIYPYHVSNPKSTDDIVMNALNLLLSMKNVGKEDLVVILSGTPGKGPSIGANFIEITSVKKAMEDYGK